MYKRGPRHPLSSPLVSAKQASRPVLCLVTMCVGCNQRPAAKRCQRRVCVSVSKSLSKAKRQAAGRVARCQAPTDPRRRGVGLMAPKGAGPLKAGTTLSSQHQWNGGAWPRSRQKAQNLHSGLAAPSAPAASPALGPPACGSGATLPAGGRTPPGGSSGAGRPPRGSAGGAAPGGAPGGAPGSGTPAGRGTLATGGGLATVTARDSMAATTDLTSELLGVCGRRTRVRNNQARHSVDRRTRPRAKFRRSRSR